MFRYTSSQDLQKKPDKGIDMTEFEYDDRSYQLRVKLLNEYLVNSDKFMDALLSEDNREAVAGFVKQMTHSRLTGYQMSQIMQINHNFEKIAVQHVDRLVSAQMAEERSKIVSNVVGISKGANNE